MKTLSIAPRKVHTIVWFSAAMLFCAMLFYSSLARADVWDPGYYLQGSIGESYRDSPSDSGINGLDLSGNGHGTGLKLVGGGRFNSLFGAEVGVIGLRSTTIYSPSGPVRYTSTLETFEGTLNYPVSTDNGCWLVARAGIGLTQSKVDISGVAYSSNSDQAPFIAGVGLHIAVAPRLDVVVDYDYLGKTGAFQNGGKQSDALISLGLRVNF